jgi:hypothetical protein
MRTKMSTTRYFQATRADGTIVKRTSTSRVYSHAVVIECTVVPDASRRYRPEGGTYWLKPEWASRLDLAQKNAARYNNMQTAHSRYRAWVLPAVEVNRKGNPVRTVEQLKALCREANARGDEKALNALIEELERMWPDHAAAHRFYTELELTALPPRNGIEAAIRRSEAE